MIEYLSPSVSSFVLTLIGASVALGACGVLVGTMTHRYRKQAIDLAQRYLGVRGQHRAAVGQLEKTLGQFNEKQREVHLASAHADSTAQLNARLQGQYLTVERKANNLGDENRDLRSKVVRFETHNIELQTLAKQQQSMLAQATDALDRARNDHAQAHANATDRGAALAKMEQRVKDVMGQLTNASKVAHDLHAHNQSLSRQLADAEKRVAERERTVINTELQLASKSDKVAVATKVMETHAQHVARIAELSGHLDQAQNRISELEKLHGEKAGVSTDLHERLLKTEAAHAEMIAESRDRLSIITKLTDDLNNTRLALGNAHLLINQHDAMNKEQWLKLQDAHGELAGFKSQGQSARVTATQPIVVTMPALPKQSVSVANLTPEQQAVVDRANAAPGMQSVLTKMANELLKTQRSLDGTQGKLDELLHSGKSGDASGLADIIKANEVEIASLKQDLQAARQRYNDAKEHNSAQATRIGDLSRQVRDLQTRYEAANQLADELRTKVEELDARRLELETEVDQRRTMADMTGDHMGFPQHQGGATLPSFVTGSVEAPRFVKNHDRITIDPPLDAISGMTPKDVSALRHAAIMTPGDLASLSEEQLQTIVKPTIWRRPDYASWIRQARQIQMPASALAAEIQPEIVVIAPQAVTGIAAVPNAGSNGEPPTPIAEPATDVGG